MNGKPLDAVSLAARLRLLRTQLGLSQEQLARRLSVSFATVNRWEAGRSRPSARAIRAIAELEAEGGGRREATGLEAEGGGRREARDQGPTGESSGRLPLAQSSFVWRERELGELSGLLARARLINLTGPGGAGKTRLAIEAVRRRATAVGESDVVFVPLETVRPPRSVASALASRLGLRERPGVPVRESVLAELSGRPRLLLLDGAEHHREEVAGLAGDLLASAAGVRIVVTSRVVLGAPGEVCWAVPPLDCPSVTAGASEIVSCDAVRLFIARASDRLPGFSPADVPPHAAGELCRRLGGLPLAIELIAGWVGTLSIREILQQRVALLEYDPPGAQGSRRLADVLRASYGLLEPGQQRTLRMFSVFAGPAGLADIQAVLGVGGPEAAAAIRGLVDASWLAVTRGVEQNRFGMVEAIRVFATARLEEAGEAAQARRRHAAHFARVAAQGASSSGGPDARRWATRLEAAADDLHAALQWAAETGDIDLGLDVSTALSRWWLASGRLSVGRAWFKRFLGIADVTGEGHETGAGGEGGGSGGEGGGSGGEGGGSGGENGGSGGENGAPTAAGGVRIGRALSSAAALAAEGDEYGEAVRLAGQALRIFEPLGPSEDLALAETVLGSAQRYLGERAEARRSFQAALDLRAAAGDRARLAMAMNNMALIELDDGNLDRGRELFEQTLIIKRQIGEPRSIAIGLLNLADVLIRVGRWQAARAALAEAAELAVGQPQVMGTVLCNQGNLAARQRKWAQAAESYRAAVAASRAGGHTHDVVEAMIGLGRACHRLGQADEAARHLRAAEALAHEIANPRLLAAVAAALAEVGETAAGRLPGDLTARQAEVLRLLADGLSNKQIAARLYLSPGTVERHLVTIYRKLGLGGRVEAARYAVESGLARH